MQGLFVTLPLFGLANLKILTSQHVLVDVITHTSRQIKSILNNWPSPPRPMFSLSTEAECLKSAQKAQNNTVKQWTGHNYPSDNRIRKAAMLVPKMTHYT